jgi:mRNA interferase MazF
MERFVKGDVVVLPFPFTNLAKTKKRPAMVVATFEGENIILAQITRVKRKDKHVVSLNKKDFTSGFLKYDSFIMPTIVFTSERSMVSYKAGRLKKEKVKQVEEELVAIFTK